MTQIILDKSLRTRLNGLNAEIEFLDECGQALGHFIPQKAYVKLLCLIAESRCPYSEEEMRKSEKETGGKALAEIWKSLGQT